MSSPTSATSRADALPKGRSATAKSGSVAWRSTHPTSNPDLVYQVLDPSNHATIETTRAGRPDAEPVQLRLRRKDGGIVWTEVRLVPVTDPHGTVLAVEGIARDISASKQAEEALRDALHRETRAAENLRELDAMKNGFLQAVSHELRTPLTAVIGFSALLEQYRQLDEDRYQLVVGRLGANARRLERLLTDLLDVDRMTRGALEPQRSETDLFGLVRRVASDMLTTAKELRFHGDPISADVDGPKVERIVENLLRNAERHAPSDSPIDVTVTATEGGALLVVEDRGAGVPDDLKEAVFEPFRQGDTPATRVGGLGVGLTVVATFAKLHGGRAWVDDRDGGGAAFKVLLPARLYTGPEPLVGHN